MLMATVCLQMTDGREVWFRAPQHQVHQLVIKRHKHSPSEESPKKHLIITEKRVPISIDLNLVRRIQIT